MIGAIIGDIVGSIYEFDNIKTKTFPFFSKEKEFTDDSILTLATAEWMLRGGNPADYYLKYAQTYPYPMGSYGSMFISWIHLASRGIMMPYNSCGNGSAMRVALWDGDSTLWKKRFQSQNFLQNAHIIT